MKLARKATRGAIATLAGQWTRLAVQTASTMVLARLLTPDAYGLVGMVFVFVMLAMLLKDLGLNTATVQRRTITHEQINTLFWINLAVGVVIAALFWVSAEAIAGFYGRPELTGIVIGLSFAVIFGSLASQPQALLSRRMDFTATAVIDVAAMVCGAVTAVVAALLGAGYWALVALHVTQHLARAVLVWRRCGWRPTRPARCEDMRSLLSFGGYLSVTQLLSTMTRHLDNLLIGRYVGATQLGYYAKAYELVLLPLRQIQDPLARVAIPTLSRLQDDPERYRRYYTAAVSAVVIVSMPLLVLLMVSAEEVVLVLLGSQWMGTVPLFRILALAGIAQVVSHTTGWLFVSLGRVRRQAAWFVATRPLFVVAFIAGLPWGARGVVIGYTLVVYLLLVPFYIVGTRGSPVRMADVLRAAWHPALISVGTYLVADLARDALVTFPLFLRLAGTFAAGSAFFVIVTLAWPGARRQAMTFLAVVRSSFRNQGRTEDAEPEEAHDAPRSPDSAEQPRQETRP